MAVKSIGYTATLQMHQTSSLRKHGCMYCPNIYGILSVLIVYPPQAEVCPWWQRKERPGAFVSQWTHARAWHKHKDHNSNVNALGVYSVHRVPMSLRAIMAGGPQDRHFRVQACPLLFPLGEASPYLESSFAHRTHFILVWQSWVLVWGALLCSCWTRTVTPAW